MLAGASFFGCCFFRFRLPSVVGPPVSNRFSGCLRLFESDSERRIANLFPDRSGADALRANPNGLCCSVRGRCSDTLQVRQKGPACDAGNFRTDPAEIFCFSACFNAVADASPFSANLANSCHRGVRKKTAPHCT